MTSVYDKFVDLQKKANYWLEITQKLPSACSPECWNLCYDKSFRVHEKLWNFQQENRRYLEKDDRFTREMIGDIAWSIASTYLNYYIRCSSKDYLKRSILFFSAIKDRAYFELIKKTKKFQHYLMCFSAAAMLSTEFLLARDLLETVSEIDYPTDSDKSFTMSQPNLVLNDIEILLQISYGGKLFLRPPIQHFCTNPKMDTYKSSAFLSVSAGESEFYGSLSISNILLSGFMSSLKNSGLAQYFLKDSDSIGVMNAIYHALHFNCKNTDEILIIHLDAPVVKSLSGEDVFYLRKDVDGTDNDDFIFELGELKCLKRKLIIISERFMKLPSDNFGDSLFMFIPMKNSCWSHSFSYLLYSVEFLFYDLYSKEMNPSGKGKIEDRSRVSAQTYLKFISRLVEESTEGFKYRWVSESLIGFHLLCNYIMSYYFLSWNEFRTRKKHLDCPIQIILPFELVTCHEAVYKFLNSVTGSNSN